MGGNSIVIELQADIALLTYVKVASANTGIVIEGWASVTINGNGFTINGGGFVRCLYIGETVTNVVLNNIFFTNGFSPSNGGAVYVLGSAGLLTINDFTFISNVAGTGGGALYVNAKQVELIACTISGNKASNGAGLYSYGAVMELTSTIISSNTAADNGDGVYLYFGSSAFIGCNFAVRRCMSILTEFEHDFLTQMFS